MELAIETVDGVTVIQISGRLEAANKDALRSAVDDCLADRRTRFLLALDGLDFIDSSGLGCLVSCLRRADQAGGTLKISGLRNYVAKLFETTRLDRVFAIFPDRASALKTF